VHEAAVMESDELVKCPVCDGHASVRRSDLTALLTGANLREKLEKNIAEFTPIAEADRTAHKLQPIEFKKEVHNWNPALPIWRRSPKE